MAKQRSAARLGSSKPRRSDDPPAPFKRPNDVLEPFISTLDPGRVYITHVDTKPAEFKRNVFLVPVVMNMLVAALFVWRVRYIGPWYLRVLTSALGEANETTVIAADSDLWEDLIPVVAHRSAHLCLDLILATFLWPWPVRFVLPTIGGDAGSPASWRWRVGFRNKEVVVRRSRGAAVAESSGGGTGIWGGRGKKRAPKATQSHMGDVVGDENSRALFMARVGMATDPMRLHEKTGYVLMDADWDLDWAGMVDATAMVDEKLAAIEAFSNVVLVHHAEFGWLSLDLKQQSKQQNPNGGGGGDGAGEDERRRQVLAFRQGLADAGHEDLFYRWIELIQFEASQPGGFTEAKQVEAADKVRRMFEDKGVDFDKMWKDSVGVDPAESALA